MERNEFIKTCGYACIGASSIGMLLQSCVSNKSITANIENENLVVPISDFLKDEAYLKYIIVRNNNLRFPIYVFRFSENEYTALYLQCTHQGNELNAYGDKLVCPAHGSEFNNKGMVTNGPATDPLRSFPIQISNPNILISLKKA
ncbi:MULTISPECIES: Rieske (2Fe-2S) protein [Arenibacter]|uniref:3-phenylpropionate dioxygenase ferredoxin subunit n=1 Tax=Arenibacter algicola TaxID=616991 RepID=A0A221UXX7_9FLAO|nr:MULTISPECIES: Rieske (2Fe-2S) protein [Arenibacter]ASO06028.1 3-phenylpropionate dioxygenase ferredoxin subunit [Arenibacter algicola]MCK0137172.1 Rieske (2Fe-2S) protein [Arenibacter sp. S6351L]MCK0189096.1 Rieske (2Fe-2S) protein [Arenibacter sp. F20364]MDX1768122.1 Rieske (2Fe-2S) protein [Arenibacter troitsensis]|tara:strand:- start:3394 stop:3828 length:435 start_codon:yes stop_codon:yes gene_type:complete